MATTFEQVLLEELQEEDDDIMFDDFSFIDSFIDDEDDKVFESDEEDLEYDEDEEEGLEDE